MSDQNTARDHKMAAHKTKREQENDIKNARNPRQARYLRELQSFNGDPLTNGGHPSRTGANVSTRSAAKASTTASPRQHPLKRAAEANKGRGGDRSAGSAKKRKTSGRLAGKAPATQTPAVESAPNAGVTETAQDDGTNVAQPANNDQNQQQTRRPPRKTRVTAKEDWAVENEQVDTQPQATTNNHTAPPPPPSIFGPSTPSPGTVQRSMRNMQPLQLADVPAAPGSLAKSVSMTKEGRKWKKKSEKKQHEQVRKSLGRAKTPDF
ncbi:hypothetical protein PRZ48_005130 [Zasmidium cellare]|uniref:Uncharacterized protein n=1 Tax=Zasmidium cellare TaxID=395010 RepID=A0ABR0ERI1_ZASCE|nr:hypothetical protein PRZ48_005130 [Zasmidium cellare]